MFTFENPMVDLVRLPLESEMTDLQCLPLKVYWWTYYIYLSKVKWLICSAYLSESNDRFTMLTFWGVKWLIFFNVYLWEWSVEHGSCHTECWTPDCRREWLLAWTWPQSPLSGLDQAQELKVEVQKVATSQIHFEWQSARLRNKVPYNSWHTF